MKEEMEMTGKRGRQFYRPPDNAHFGHGIGHCDLGVIWSICEVVESEGQSGSVLIGFVVDSVSEVLSIKGGDMEETPTFGAKLDTDYILGMAKMNGGVKILLDIDKVLGREEIAVLQESA